MHDPRITSLAKVLIQHSTRLQKGEKILIEAIDVPPQIVIDLIREARRVGGIPLVTLKNNQILRELYRGAEVDQMQLIGNYELYRMQKMQAYVGIRGSWNISETSDVPSEKLQLYQRYWFAPVHIKQRVPHTKWVVLRWPTPSMAQQAEMSTEGFEQFYFDVCTLDYAKMDAAMEPLKAWMERTDQVHITGPGTDLTFSIRGMPAIKCSGTHNIPDGECFTAPVRDSVNGTITFNTATLYHGTIFTNVSLTLEKGKIVKATANHTTKLNQILDSDEGARYIGEFSFGLNPYITRTMKDILFDEKIAGSFHFTPGSAYEYCDNGNRSEVHWDMVMIQTPEYGGGEIWFDGTLIRKDGRFIPESLHALNPERLK